MIHLKKHHKSCQALAILLSISFIISSLFNSVPAYGLEQTDNLKVSLGFSGLTAGTEEQAGSTLYYGMKNSQPVAWQVRQVENGSSLSLSSVQEYASEDENAFFDQLMTDEEKTAVTNQNGGPYSQEGQWMFGLYLSANQIAFTLPADSQLETFDKNIQVTGKERKAVVSVTDNDVEAEMLSDSDTQKIHLGHLAASSVLPQATALAAMILDEQHNVCYYGKVNDADQTETTIEIPQDL